LTGFSEQAELAGFSILSEVFYMTNLQIYFKTSAASAYLGLKVFRKFKVWTKLAIFIKFKLQISLILLIFVVNKP
jgi:hypothetical protein